MIMYNNFKEDVYSFLIVKLKNLEEEQGNNTLAIIAEELKELIASLTVK